MEAKFIRDRITKLRMEKNVSEREMSISLGKAHNYIHSITSGKMLPTMESFFDICDYLDITPLNFFDANIENPFIIEEITRELKRLSNHKMQILLDMLKAIEPNHFQIYLEFMENFRNEYKI